MTKQDDRTPEQKKTHIWGVVARDKFMSGWGGAKSGASRCAWACSANTDVNSVRDRIASRSEMIYVNIVNLNSYTPPRGTAHYHIYVEKP